MMIISAIRNLLQTLDNKTLIKVRDEVSNMILTSSDLLTIQIAFNQHRTIDTNSIFYVDNLKQIMMSDGEIIPLNKYSPEDEIKQYFDNRPNFSRLDRKLLVNLDQIVAFDSFMFRVYASETLSIQINGDAMKRIVKRELSHLEDLSINKKMSIEYAPKRKGC